MAGYYCIPERVIHKTYPVYAPGREPAGYAEWLETVEPQPIRKTCLITEERGLFPVTNLVLLYHRRKGKS